MLHEEVTYTLECDFSKLLPFINSTIEKNRAMNFNRNLKSSLYPLTQTFLQAFYRNTNFSNLKATSRNINCAADVYSYFLQAYGYKEGSEQGAAGGKKQSSGLNPFGFLDLDLGFSFKDLQWFWWLILIGGIYVVVKK